MLKEHLRGYSTKTKKYNVKTNHEIEGWRENQDSSTSLFPTVQGCAPFTVSTLGEINKSPRYPRSQNSVSYMYSETGKSFSNTSKHKKSLFDLKVDQNLNIIYQNSVSNQTDLSFSILKKINKGKIKDFRIHTEKYSEDSLGRNNSESDLAKLREDNLETERIDGCIENKSKILGFNSRLKHKKVLNNKIKNEEQKFNLIYGNEQDMIEKLYENQNGKKVKRVSHLNDIFYEHTNIEQSEEIDETLSGKSEMSKKSCDSLDEVSKDFQVRKDSSKKYEVVINRFKTSKKELGELGEIDQSLSENEEGGNRAKKSSRSNLKSLSDLGKATNQNKRKDAFDQYPKSSLKTTRKVADVGTERLNEDFQSIDNQKYKITFSKLNLETMKPDIFEEKSNILTSKSPNPTKLSKKSHVPIQKKIRKVPNSKKNLKKNKKKKPLKSDSKRETKNTFKSTTMTESEDKSIYQTPDYSSPLSALLNNTSEKLPTLYTLPEFDIENLTEKQNESFRKRNLKSGTLFAESKSAEKFPLLRQKHIREFTSPQNFHNSKSKKFSKGPSNTIISRFPSDPDSKLELCTIEKVDSVERFIRNFSNSMLASLHVMVVNLTTSLEALSSDKKSLELKKLKNFFGIYPDLNSAAKKEKINKRLKIELNICINMANDRSILGQGKALNFLMSKIKKSIICEGIKKDMLKFLEDYKGSFDKEDLESGLKEILNTKLQQYDKNIEKVALCEINEKKIQSKVEKIIESPVETKEKVGKTSEIVNKSRENTTQLNEKNQESLNSIEKQKIHLNEFNPWKTGLDKNIDEDNIYKELKSLEFGKTLGSFVFSSKIDESYLPTNKVITNLTANQQEIEVDQDLNNLAYSLKKYNFFKLKEKDFELNDEKFKLIIQNLHEIDPLQKKYFEKVRIQKYLSRLDFYKSKKKVLHSQKP